MLKIGLLVALGFFVAALLALMLAPVLWRRAVRLTTRRIQGTIPLSMSDIQADKDQLRAEFAMSTRKLEMNVDELKRRTSSQVMDISKQAGKVKTLTTELQEQKDIVSENQETIKTLIERLARAEDEATGYLKSFKEATLKLSKKNEQYEQKLNVLNAVTLKTDERKVEIAALKTRLAGKEQELQVMLTRFENELATINEDRESLANGINDMQRQHSDQMKELESLRTRDVKQSGNIERLEVMLKSAEEAKAPLVEECETLRTDLVRIRDEAENGWEEERIENAMLRERLNDVAAEVARMTSALEGDDGVIEDILSNISIPEIESEDQTPSKKAISSEPAKGKQTNGKSRPEHTSLAARIRALQAQASRV